MEIVNQIVSEKEEKNILEMPMKETQEEVQVEQQEKMQEYEEKEVQMPEEMAEPTNCVALTVRKDYKLTIVKNIAKKGAKMSWKVALSIAVINFLNTFF